MAQEVVQNINLTTSLNTVQHLNSSIDYVSCDGRGAEEICNQVSPMVADTVLACISFLVNILHLGVLVKFYKANNNMCILLKLAFSDVLRSVTIILTSNCPGQTLLLQHNILCIITTIINDVLIALTLASLTMAGIDRYLAVCKPFEYIENWFVKHFNKINMIICSTIAVYIAVQNSMINGSCVMGSKMCGVYSLKPIYLLYLGQALLFCGASLVVIAICYVKIFKEFSSMIGKLKMEARHIKRMSIVVGTITVLFFLLYLPLIFGIVDSLCGEILGNNGWIALYSLLTVHGIVNAATYGWQKKAYRKYVRSLLCCENAVVNEDTAMESATTAA